MTQIDFYILPDTADEARWHFACRLTDTAVRKGHRVLLATSSAVEARLLDDLLWTFKPESFIPHGVFLQGEAPDGHLDQSPVAITTTDLPDHQLHEHQDLLINLGAEIPPWFSRFERVCEIVVQEAAVLKNTRDHFSFYRQRGYPIKHRNL